MRPNKPICQSLEQRNVFCRTKQGEQVACVQKPQTSQEVLEKLWLVGGEERVWCSGSLVLSLKLQSSTWVGTLLPTEELKDIVMYNIFLEEEPGPCLKAALLFLDCSLHSPPSLISNYLILPFETQGRSRRLNEAYCLRIRNREHRKYLYPGAPQGPGLVSIASVSQGKISILQDCHPTPPPTHFRYQLQAQVITCASDRTGIDWRFPTTPSLDFRH